MKEKFRRWDLVWRTFQMNSRQLAFGSYAAEMSFYVIWAAIPILLTIANMLALIPFNQERVANMAYQALPSEIAQILIPLVESYIGQASSGNFILSLLISLWPASLIFNTFQRVFNIIYKVETQRNMVFARAIAFLFSLVITAVIGSLSIIFLFGEKLVLLLDKWLMFDLSFALAFFRSTWVFGMLGVFILLMLLYHYMPNVHWPWRYSLPGTLVAMCGMGIMRSMFHWILDWTVQENSSQTALGVLMIILVWLYFNGFIITFAAYVNVFYHDYHVQLQELTMEKLGQEIK